MTTSKNETHSENFHHAFDLLAQTGQGVLSTISLAVEGYPFGSVTPYCLDREFRPNILISSLAQHTKNILANPKVSLTVVEENRHTNKQAKGRLTYVADAVKVENDQDIKQRYLSYFPEAANYFQTHDFFFYQLNPVRIRYIGGFGKIFWLEQEQFTFQNIFTSDQETSIVQHMNNDHQHNIKSYLTSLMGLKLADDDQYRMAGLDQFGADFMLNGKLQRLNFEQSMTSPEQARGVFVELAKRARS